jgi:hypothetical protein
MSSIGGIIYSFESVIYYKHCYINKKSYYYWNLNQNGFEESNAPYKQLSKKKFEYIYKLNYLIMKNLLHFI